MASQSKTADDAPTVTEYIPTGTDSMAEDNDKENVARVLQPTGNGGLKEVTIKPYTDAVSSRVFVCDVCGDSFDTEDAAGHHHNYNH